MISFTKKKTKKAKEEIEEELNEIYGDDYLKQILNTNSIDSVRTLKNNMVWQAVSSYCTDRAYS